MSPDKDCWGRKPHTGNGVCESGQYCDCNAEHDARMLSKAGKKDLDRATLRDVKKEMAEPRMAQSTRNGDVLGRAGRKKKPRPHAAK
jgi:hypothetical protein